MSAPKKRTPRSVERHAVNRKENEARQQANERVVREAGLGIGSTKRSSKLVRQDQRFLARIDVPRAELPEGGDAA